MNMPIDFTPQKHRGFAFVEFESAEDASKAMNNMNDAQIDDKMIRVNIAKSIKLKEGSERLGSTFMASATLWVRL